MASSIICFILLFIFKRILSSPLSPEESCGNILLIEKNHNVAKTQKLFGFAHNLLLTLITSSTSMPFPSTVLVNLPSVSKTWYAEKPPKELFFCACLSRNQNRCLRGCQHCYHFQGFEYCRMITDNPKLSPSIIHIMRRFDIATDGAYIGFEDICSLQAPGTAQKYSSTYERVGQRAFGTLYPVAV